MLATYLWMLVLGIWFRCVLKSSFSIQMCFSIQNHHWLYASYSVTISQFSLFRAKMSNFLFWTIFYFSDNYTSICSITIPNFIMQLLFLLKYKKNNPLMWKIKLVKVMTFLCRCLRILSFPRDEAISFFLSI